MQHGKIADRVAPMKESQQFAMRTSQKLLGRRKNNSSTTNRRAVRSNNENHVGWLSSLTSRRLRLNSGTTSSSGEKTPGATMRLCSGGTAGGTCAATGPHHRRCHECNDCDLEKLQMRCLMVSNNPKARPGSMHPQHGLTWHL